MEKKWKIVKKCKTKPYFSLICQLENWTSEQYPLQIATESYPVKKKLKKRPGPGGARWGKKSQSLCLFFIVKQQISYVILSVIMEIVHQ